MGNRVELNYEGKHSPGDILSTAPASLREVERLGQRRLGDERDNMLISGNNLPVLSALLKKPEIAGQIKLVYIDPPFGTNQEFRKGVSRTVSKIRSDEIAYMDNLVGADYLEFLRERLILLKEILAEDGSIYVHAKWAVGHYIKVLLDEIFGEKRHINTITRIKGNPKGSKRKAYGNMTDVILFYSKGPNYVWKDSREEFTEEEIKRLFPKVDEQERRYTTLPLHGPGETLNGPSGKPWRGRMPPKGSHWQYPPEMLDKFDEQGLIEWSLTGNPRRKYFADEAIKRKKKRQSVWQFKDPYYPRYPTEKNLEMLKAIVEASSRPNDLVLDAFCGSGTTLVASEQLGRKWIGIDNSNHAINVARERLLAVKDISGFLIYEQVD